MPVQIGAPGYNFSDPTGLLSDCHRRIEMFLRVLRRRCVGHRSPIDRRVSLRT